MSAKESLIQSLIDSGYLKSPSTIQAFCAIDRADFVLPEYKSEAYENYALPIGENQTISQPLTVAFMLETLDPRPGDKILDIGAGSGWQTALLAHIVGKEGKITALERIPKLCDFLRENLEKYDLLKNSVVEISCQDATIEIPEGKYDKIIAAASAYKKIPDIWRERLKFGGRIIAPIKNSIWLFERISEKEWKETEFPGFVFVPLVGSRKTEAGGGIIAVFITTLVISIFILTVINITYPKLSLNNQGVEKREISITVPEGWSTIQIQNQLQKKNAAGGEGFAQTISAAGSKKFEQTFDFLRDKPESAGLEGYLFPDTYRIYTTSNADRVVIRMLKNFDQKMIPALKQDTDLQDKTIFEIITMASMIEKEVISYEDRLIVSGILWKRLEMNIPLQVDATITYIKNQNGNQEPNNPNNGKISIQDIKIDSPYNTYLNKGLPIGPISNPGLSSIKAAIYPKQSPYLYYLSKPDGETIFSRTLEEHNYAKTKYLR